jgi:hypothetical protein
LTRIQLKQASSEIAKKPLFKHKGLVCLRPRILVRISACAAKSSVGGIANAFIHWHSPFCIVVQKSALPGCRCPLNTPLDTAFMPYSSNPTKPTLSIIEFRPRQVHLIDGSDIPIE